MLRSNSVEQMFQLLIRFKNKYERNYNVDKAHIEATNEVAQNYQITRNTVHDMCFRRLNLPNINQFRNLLEKWVLGDPKPLLEILKKFIPSDYHIELETVIKENKFDKNNTSYLVKNVKKLEENFTLALNREIAKKLKVLAIMEGISNSEWLKKNIVKFINHEYNNWLANQRNNISES